MWCCPGLAVERPDVGCDEPAPLGRRDPFGPSPSEWPPLHPRVHPHHSPLLDPGIAEALAALLDVLAGQIERGTEAIDPQTRLTAVSLARTANCADPSPSAAAAVPAPRRSTRTRPRTRSPRDIPKPSQQVQGPPPGGTHTASTLEPHDPC